MLLTHVEFEAINPMAADLGEVVAHFQSAEPDLGIGMGLGEMAARVEHYLRCPRGFFLRYVVWQKRLREILVECSAEVAISQLRDLRSRCVHDLAGVSR